MSARHARRKSNSHHPANTRLDPRPSSPLLTQPLPRGQIGARWKLEALAVILVDLERRRIYAFQTAGVNGAHVAAAGSRAFGKGLDAAGCANEVVNLHLVELIVREHIFPRQQLELVQRYEREQRA